jgi:hypothetical protein
MPHRSPSRSRALAVACALTLAAGGASAQAPPAPPDSVAASFLRAVAGARWAEAATYLDRPSVERVRRNALRAARFRTGDVFEVTAEWLMQREPDMPREVAEYQVRKSRESRARAFDLLAHEFARVADTTALATLPADSLAARWIEARDYRYRMRRALSERGCTPPDSALALMGRWQPPVTRVLGSVVRDSSAYVLHATEPEVQQRRARELEPQVMQLRAGPDGRWRILARHDVLSGGVMGFSFEGCAAGGPRRR